MFTQDALQVMKLEDDKKFLLAQGKGRHGTMGELTKQCQLKRKVQKESIGSIQPVGSTEMVIRQ